MEKLSEIITCKVCNKYFSNPVVLPCLKSVCQDHITFESNCQIFKCKFCNKDHVSNDGFNLSKELMDLINLNLHLDEKTKSTKSVLDNLENVNKEIDLIAKDPEDFIFTYFSKEKNKIDLKRETLISKIHDISDKMINKMKQMEIDSKSNLSEKQQNLIDSAKFDYKKLTDRVLAWKDEIRNPKLNSIRLEEIFKESNDLLKENDSQSFGAKNKILNQNGCFFLPNNDEFKDDLFGELIIDNYKITFHCEKNNYSKIKFDSNILNKVQSNELIKLCEFQNKKEFKLLYRATRDGFSSKAFHSKCDEIPRTLTIIKVKDKSHIFGGYTEATWEDYNTYKQYPNAFIFSLVNNDNKPIKMKANQNIQQAIYCHTSYGPIFGGSDFEICSNSNTNASSLSNLGHTYQHPNYQYQSNEAKSFLAGSFNFSTSEIEVYQII
jgi:hypothetical protein